MQEFLILSTLCAQREFLIDALGAFDLESGLRSSSNERISVVSLGKRKCIMQSRIRKCGCSDDFTRHIVRRLMKLDDNYIWSKAHMDNAR